MSADEKVQALQHEMRMMLAQPNPSRFDVTDYEPDSAITRTFLDKISKKLKVEDLTDG
jgi:hypothetical protein